MHILDKTIFEILDLYELPRPSSVFQAGASSGQEIDVFFTQGIEVGVFIEPLDLPFLALCKKCISTTSDSTFYFIDVTTSSIYVIKFRNP